MNFFIRERNHLNLGIFVSMLLLVFPSMVIALILEENFGYFLLFIPSIFIFFGIMKLAKSFFLMRSLKKLEENFPEDRMNIYIYESWHKKLVANYWIWITFIFIYIYAIFIYTIIYFLNLNVIANVQYWIYIVVIIALAMINFIFYKINSVILYRNITFGKDRFDNMEDKAGELKLVSLSVKNDYKFMMFLIFSVFMIIPLFFWFSPRARDFYKDI